MLEFGPGLSGKVIVKDIGIPLGTGTPEAFGDPPYYSRVTSAFDEYARHFAKDSLGKPEFKSLFRNTHKYAHGHALILSGGPGHTGAARLAARGALRIGAGLVTLACPRQALWEVAAQITAVMSRTLDGAPGLTEALEDTRLNALCLGPGMGLGADTHHLVLAALKANRGTVLDADALTRFEREPQVLFDALHDKCVLTPHAGEFRRLFPDIAKKLDAPATTGPAYSKVDATREAAARAGCTVLFKGPDTVIADKIGRCSINSSAYDRAAPWLATAGSGDVLAGFITGLLARGFPPMQAAETAAWLHTECALSFGPGLIAEDLPEELPKVFRALGL
ncbi:MAG: NAD(P)H-hydrate dehydratase [Miltoncostaeaceae bacterium]